MSTPPPARCHIGAEWNDGQGAGLHLSDLNGTASPASYPQHGFVVQSVRMPRFWGDTGSNPVEARWAQWPHAKRWVPEREIVCRNGFAVVAQLAEQRPRNAQVTGPNPVDGSFSTKTDLFFLLCLAGFREVCNRTGVEDSGTAAVAQLAEQPPGKRQVVGS